MSRPTKKPRRKRGVRSRGRRAMVVTPRDEQVLTFLGLHRYATTSQVARECDFASGDRSTRRLRQLLDAGLTVAHLRASTQPTIHALSAEGHRYISARQPQLTARLQRPGRIPLGGVAHHLALTDARCYIAALARASASSQLLRWSGGRGDVAQELACDRHGLVPDGVAELMHGSRTVCLLVEVDLSTEPRATIEAKLAKYRSLPRLARWELWVFSDGTAARRLLLSQAADAAGLGSRVRLVPLERARRRPVVAAPRAVRR